MTPIQPKVAGSRLSILDPSNGKVEVQGTLVEREEVNLFQNIDSSYNHVGGFAVSLSHPVHARW